MIDYFKKNYRYEHQRFTKKNPTCPRCGTPHHWDLGCPVCMKLLKFGHALKAYKRLAGKNSAEIGLNDISALAEGFRILASSIVSRDDNKEYLGISFWHLFEESSPPRTEGSSSTDSQSLAES